MAYNLNGRLGRLEGRVNHTCLSHLSDEELDRRILELHEQLFRAEGNPGGYEPVDLNDPGIIEKLIAECSSSGLN